MFNDLINKDLRDQLLTALPTEPNKTLQETVDFFTENKQEALSSVLMGLSFQQIHDALATKKTRKSSKPSIPSVDGWKEDSVREQYKASVMTLITKTGMGESRGITPIEIRRTLGVGSELQTRETLTELEEEGLVASTGKTKGKRFVPASMLSEAEEFLLKEMEERDAKKAEAEARRAEAESLKAQG
jgi:hypothetical protein